MTTLPQLRIDSHMRSVYMPKYIGERRRQMGHDGSLEYKLRAWKFLANRDKVMPVVEDPECKIVFVRGQDPVDVFGLGDPGDEGDVDLADIPLGDGPGDLIDLRPTSANMSFYIDLFTRMSFLPATVRTWRDIGLMLAWQALTCALHRRAVHTIVLMDKKKGHPAEEAKNEERRKRSERQTRLQPHEYPDIPARWGDPRENRPVFDLPGDALENGVAMLATPEERETKRKENWRRLAGDMWSRMWGTPDCRHHVKEYVMDAIVCIFFQSRKITPHSTLLIDGMAGDPLRYSKSVGRDCPEVLENHMIAESDISAFHWFLRGEGDAVIATVDTDLLSIGLLTLYYSLGQCPKPPVVEDLERDGDAVLYNDDYAERGLEPPGRQLYILMDGKLVWLNSWLQHIVHTLKLEPIQYVANALLPGWDFSPSILYNVGKDTIMDKGLDTHRQPHYIWFDREKQEPVVNTDRFYAFCCKIWEEAPRYRGKPCPAFDSVLSGLKRLVWTLTYWINGPNDMSRVPDPRETESVPAPRRRPRDDDWNSDDDDDDSKKEEVAMISRPRFGFTDPDCLFWFTGAEPKLEADAKRAANKAARGNQPPKPRAPRAPKAPKAAKGAKPVKPAGMPRAPKRIKPEDVYDASEPTTKARKTKSTKMASESLRSYFDDFDDN